MNTMTFDDAVRTDTSLLIAIAGASGSGKTTSALRLAVGLAGGEPIAFIDTEAGRARHYFPISSDNRTQEELGKERLFRCRYLDLQPPFSPDRLWQAIEIAITRENAKVVVIDSFSDSWEGMGGLHDMHNAEIARLAKKELSALSEFDLMKFNFPAWNVPKSRYKAHLMQKLRQVRAHIIFCLRAEEKTESIQDPETKRTKIVNAGWTPIAEKKLMFEMAISFTVTPDNAGVPLMRNGQAVYGKLNPPYLQFFPVGKQITEEVGEKLRTWARGENTNVAANASSQAQRQDAGADLNQLPASPEFIRILNAYHADLAGADTAQDITARHQGQRETLLTMPESLVKVAQQILSAHNARANGRADAEAVAAHVQTIIDGVA